MGKFIGQCTIQLTGQAVIICCYSGVEINKWPYKYISQFTAEEETSEFSFVSGRLGPYGVGEYNFKMHGRASLMDLESALVEFTGVQFSIIEPLHAATTVKPCMRKNDESVLRVPTMEEEKGDQKYSS